MAAWKVNTILILDEQIVILAPWLDVEFHPFQNVPNRRLSQVDIVDRFDLLACMSLEQK